MLISGGASGIGEAFVRAFADNGARVAFIDLQQEAGDGARQRARWIQARPALPALRRTDTDALKAAIAEANASWGRCRRWSTTPPTTSASASPM